MLRYLPLVLTAVAILGVTVFNGLSTNRWTGVNERAEVFAAYLQAVPAEIGEWEGMELEEVDERIRKATGAVGEPVSRRYRHRDSGRIVDLWLICGHASQIVRHTPDICYPAANFRPEEKNNHYEIAYGDGRADPFWTNLFYKSDGGRDLFIRVFWAWHRPTAGAAIAWDAPGHAVKDARFRFAGSKALFKVYFSSPTTDKDEQPDESAAVEFAQEFLPAFNKLLADAAEGKPAPATESAAPPAAEPEATDTEAAA